MYGSAWFCISDHSEISPIRLKRKIPFPWLRPIWINYNLYGFHDPYCSIATLEFFKEYGVLSGQIVRKRGEVVPVGLLRFSFFIERLAISFNVLGHEILATYLIPVSKMVDPLVGEQAYLIESFIEKLFLAPVKIPVIVVCFLIAPAGELCWDAVHEESLEFDFGAE